MKKHGTPAPIVCTVDVVLLTLKGSALQVLLLRREHAPYQGAWALPGGFVQSEVDADTQASAERVLRQKVGISSPYLEQLATYSGLARDPRGWSVAVTYCALVPAESLLAALAHEVEGVADSVQLCDVTALPQLPFDHARIVADAVARVRSKSLYSSLPVFLCEAEFTLPQLQQTYEAVLGEAINKVSFRRKMDELDMLEAVPGAMRGGGAHRPAQLYRLRPGFRRSLSLLERGL